MRFENRIVLITGATGEFGPSLVRAFAWEGASVAITARHGDEFPAVLEAAGLPDERSLGVAADVTQAGDVKRLVDGVIERFGRIDALVNAAGGYRAGRAVWEMDEPDLDFMFDLNARSAFLVSRAVIPGMLQRGSGAVVNLGAKAGFQAGKKASGYAISKAAVMRLTESLSLEVRDSGINVNAVVPSIIDTAANRAASPNADHSKWVSPDDLASVILFLCSPEAKAIHGALVPVFGRV